MAQQLHIWKGTEKVKLIFGDQPNGIIKKLVNINNHIFVSTTTSNVYHGEVKVLDDGTLSITFTRIDYCATDIASNSQYLFVVNDQGYCLTIDPNTFQVVDTIILKEDVKFCSHGCKQENEVIKIKNIAISDTAALFITESGQLWASGDQPQIDIKSQSARKVVFFEGRSVSLIACGANFNVVVARKIPKFVKDDTDSENDADEVFVSSCPQCLNNAAVSPQSLTSSDTCPLGLHPQAYSEDHTAASISPMSFTGRDQQQQHLPGTTSASVSNSKDNRSINPLTSNLETLSIAEDSKEVKKNPIFINTEAARHFLTRQLSWVSSYGNGKEENSEYISNPTGLIKQNVSNMANLVYEGVKTMGDKVATLSRHVSGSSEMNETRDDITGEFELISGIITDDNAKPTTTSSLAHSLRCEEFPWSSSTASLDHDLSQQGLNERINSFVDTGSNLLSTELWTWGDIKFGQLGTGDNIKRPKPVLVTKLNNTGIKKISCGNYHVLAMTLDGRIYAWGKNDLNQISLDERLDLSSPTLISNVESNDKRGRDVCAGSQHSLIALDNELYFVGKSTHVDKIVKLDISKETQYTIKYISSSGSYSCCSTANEEPRNILNDLNNEEMFLESMLSIYQHLIKPFQKKSSSQDSNAYDALCRSYVELMNLIALNVASLSDYSNFIGEAYEVILVANVDEFITVYMYYLNAICDVISIRGFAHMAIIMNDISQIKKLILFYNHGQNSTSNEDIIASALQPPLQKLSRYKIMITNLIKCNGTNMGIERLQEALVKWEKMCDEQEKRQKEAELTRSFWENSGKLIEVLRSPERRLIRESRTHPISVLNSSRFTSHWFILLTDIFIHVIGTSHTTHPLPTLWVEPLADTEVLSNAISITAPEENLVLYATNATERNAWLQALQNAIKCSLQRVVGHVPPRDRTCSYTFIKHPSYKDAKYTGRWSNGKPHGYGKIEWSDGRLYTGQFYKGVINGTGRMEIPTQGIYEGQFREGQPSGYGSFKYINGDVYDGYFKDGFPHGHGVKKEGDFSASMATVYIGEWVAGVKQGYGVMDDIMKGEKYLGSWSNDVKHGNGLIVTLDGIYYEGAFAQDVFAGHGVMVFEDNTHYEGEFKSAGIFGGKGILTFCSGDVLEGNFNGAWNEPVKVTATLQINKAGNSNNSDVNAKPPSFAKLCVQPDQKWKALFRQCYQQFGVSEPHSRNSNSDKSSESQKLWENVAVIINKSYQKTMYKKTSPSHNSEQKERQKRSSDDLLNKIPQFGQSKITPASYQEILNYLVNAFESQHHPLGNLLSEISTVYTATYGGVRVHPLLLSHAVEELRSITMRIYDIVSIFFPALPERGKEITLETEDGGEKIKITATALLHPIILPRVYSSLFILYSLNNSTENDAYRKKVETWNRQPDITLMAFLDIDQKFWQISNTFNVNSLTGDTKNQAFIEAIETLQQLKTTFSPFEKIIVIRNTFEQITKTVQKELGTTYRWSMDELFPVFCFIVVRASVLQLGSEIHFIEDFMEPYLEKGELGIMFTTLKASYYQILQEKKKMTD